MRKIHDVIGIGIGPFNLSVLSLLANEKQVSKLFIDRCALFDWHPGMLLKGATLQNNHLKDLVSLADSASRFSFLSFLHSKKRIYEWINADFGRPLREEYNQYLKWVCEQFFSFILWGTKVLSVDLAGSLLEVNTDKEKYYSKNLVIGTGTKPNISQFFQRHIKKDNSNSLFHNSLYLQKKPILNLEDKTIVIVGGGQSGAEVVLDLITSSQKIKQLIWLTDRDLSTPLMNLRLPMKYFLLPI